MADIENQQEPTLPAKRKPDLSCHDQENLPNKTLKLQSLHQSSSPPEEKPVPNVEENHASKTHVLDSSAEQKIDNKSSNSQEKVDEDKEEDENDNGEGYEEEEDDDDDEEEEEEEELSGEAEVDRKGKGILREDKGKGKLIEGDDSDDDDDDDDDSSDGGNQSNGDSDLSDDPLAEVDLDNILPSRTRRRVVQPGVYISNDIANQDDDSDDSDA